MQTAICNSYKRDILEGVHSPTDVYKIALYKSSAILNQFTESYSPENEVSGVGYVKGGAELKGFKSGFDSAAFVSFENPEWPGSTIDARGCLIYNASKGNRAVAVFDFGQNVTSINGLFSVDLRASNLIRIN